MLIAGWDEVPGADSYEIYCGGDRENPRLVAKTAALTSAILTGTGDGETFSPGAACYVWVQAKNSAGSSPLSDPSVQTFGGGEPLYRDMAEVGGKTVTGQDSYAMKLTVPQGSGYMDEGKELTKKGVFVQGRSLTIAAFSMAKYETTNELYFAVQAWALEKGYRFANTIPVFSNDNKNKPAVGVSWRDAVVWCNAYSEMQGRSPVYRDKGGSPLKDAADAAACDGAVMDKTQNGCRLPTEAEREFAARGGDPGRPDWMFTYAGSDAANEVAWYHGNSPYQTQPVGTKKPNRLGIYDLSGNVQEWCWDWMNYNVDVSVDTPEDGAAHNHSAGDRNVGDQKAFNGGGVRSNITYSCVASRWGFSPDYKDNYLGFRVVRKP